MNGAIAVRWEIEGFEFANCNCSYACPCHFNARPTHGRCTAVFGFHIVKGHYGNTKLDGLKAVVIARFPGAIYEGRGELLTILDDRAVNFEGEQVPDHPKPRTAGTGLRFAIVRGIYEVDFGLVHENAADRLAMDEGLPFNGEIDFLGHEERDGHIAGCLAKARLLY
jgi:hypothetical protein